MFGLIHIYCGNGKGKTTAAMGLALRAISEGKKVTIVQFLKEGTSNEIKILEKLPKVTVYAGKVCKKFSSKMNEEEKAKTKELHEANFKKAIETSADMIIFDEILGAINAELLDTELVKDFISNKPCDLELVLTGRNPPDFLMEKADYITEMKKIKHPFDKGIAARKGIEF